MLGDRGGRKSTRQVAAAGPHCDDVTCKGGNWPAILQDLFNLAAERKPFFSPTHLAFQFGSKPPDDLAELRPIPASAIGLRQFRPGIRKWNRNGLRRNEELGI